MGCKTRSNNRFVQRGGNEMSLTVFEVLLNAQHNLNNNGQLGLVVGKEQLDNAIEALENGKELHDVYEEGE